MTRRKPRAIYWVETRWAFMVGHTGMTQSEMKHRVMRQEKRRQHKRERREGKLEARDGQ